MAALEVLAPDHYVGATEAVGLVVDAVETMLAAGRAYRVPSGDGEPDGQGEQIAVKLKPGLGDGTYTATYRKR